MSNRPSELTSRASCDEDRGKPEGAKVRDGRLLCALSTLTEVPFAFWNSQCFFGGVGGNHFKQGAKRSFASRLLSRFCVCAFFETRGSKSDLLTMQMDYPYHQLFGSFCCDVQAGGIMIAVHTKKQKL